MNDHRNRKGLTLLEIIIAVLLMSVIFVGVSSLYLAARKFYITGGDKAIISAEAQYAIQHIYKNAMQAIGDISNAAIDIPTDGGSRVNLRIYNPLAGPLSSSTYSDTVSYSYYLSGDELIFDNGSQNSLMEKVSVTGLAFNKIESGAVTVAFTGSITASYNNQSQTFYFSCYPRFASFN